MASKSRFSLSIIDYLVIILESVYYLSILPALTIDLLIPLPHGINLAVLIIPLYFVRFKGEFLLIRRIKRFPLVLLYLFIIFFDAIQNLIIHPSTGIVVVVFFINIVFFLEYIFSLSFHAEKSKSSALTPFRPYLYYSYYNVFIVIFAAILIVAGIISATGVQLPKMEIVEDNIDLGQTYYFPGYLSVATLTNRIFSKDIIPMLTGLSHEPHVLGFLIVPAFFLFFASRERKPVSTLVIYISYLIVLVIGQSMTAIMFFVLAVAIEFIWLFIVRKKYSTSIFLILLAGVIVFRAGDVVDGISAMILEKAGGNAYEGEGSFGYTVQMLNYVVSSSSLLGYGNYPAGAGFSLGSCSPGWITGLLDIIFFVLLLIESIKLLVSKTSYYHYVGMACFYFLIHSLKVSFLVFHYPLLAMFIMLIVLSKDSKRREVICSPSR